MFQNHDRNKLVFTIFLSFLVSASAACKGKGGGSSTPTVQPVTTASFFSSTLSGANETVAAPAPTDNLTGSGVAGFTSDGLFSHQFHFSTGSDGSASGSYQIDLDGKLLSALDGGITLHGAVNPQEDFLFLADNVTSDDGKVGVLLAANPAAFPSDSIPDFSGNYNLVGVRFLYPGGAGFDLRQSARTSISNMLIVQNQDSTTGSFFINGDESGGTVVNLHGSFSIAEDLSLAFTIDGAPGEVWTGSFAPSGLIVLSDTTLGNGDAAQYVAIPHANFPGPAPLGFEGNYRVARLQFYTDAGTAFGSVISGSIRSFHNTGSFTDACDAFLNCPPVISVNAPYLLDLDGSLTMNDLFLGSDLQGAFTPDLGAFVAVETGSSPAGLPQEITLEIGVRLLP